MNDARMYKGLMLTLVMLLSAISPILSPVSADHENGTGTGMNNYGPQIDLSIWDNNSSSWDVISPYEEVFLDIGTYQMEILSSNLSLNDSYMIEWDIFSYGVEEMMGEEEPDSIYESRNWTGYYNSSSESFNITIEEFNCGNWIEINLYNQSGMNQLAFGEYQILGPCGSNGILSTHIEIDNNEYEVEHMFITGFDGSIELETGNYNMSWSVPNQTFNYNQDYLIQFSRGVGSMDSYNETEGNYSWTDGSQQGVGLGSQTWTIEVTDETCEINNDGLLWQAAYFSNGSWDQNSSTLMSTSLTTMSGPCEMPEMPEFELHYDNGSGPVMWETVWNYEEFDNCNENTYEDGYSDWECDVDYDGDGMVDYTSYYENCEYDNASMMFWCETWEEYPYLESGNYSFTLNVTNLEVGEAYELYANYYLNTQMGYDSESTWISWNNSNESYVINNESLYILVDEYMCSLHLQFEIFTQGNNIGYDEFSFDGDCEMPEMPEFELHYDNGSGPVMWETVWNYEEFDNCNENTYEDGYSDWECDVDYDGDGMVDYTSYYENCEYDNASMMFWCETWEEYPYLESGNYTITLNVSNLEIGEIYNLNWDINGIYDNYEFNATSEYEHFELDIEVDEYLCYTNAYVSIYSNGYSVYDTFGFNGDCEMPPQPLELYYNNMLYAPNMFSEDANIPELETGTNYMSWNMLELEVGDEYNLTWEVMQMGMFGDGMEEGVHVEIFAANSEEMMMDWEVEIENDTCMVMITGVLSINGSDEWPLGMVFAMFNGPCEIEMGDIGLDMLNPDDGDWYEMDGMNGSDTLEMMMFTDSEEDEMNMIMSLMENSNMQLETGNYTMRWVFEDLEAGKEYLVFMEDLLLDMYDDSSEYAYHDNCSEVEPEEEDGWYYLCEVENDDGSIDYITYEYCYEYDDGMYECEVYDNDEDILTVFNASSDSEYYEWELTITDDTCGHVFVIGIVDAESGEDSMPIAISMYPIAGPNMSNCLDHEDDGPSAEDWMLMTDTDGDGNMSWDELITFLENEDSVDNETMGLIYQFFTESDWNGEGTLDMDELSMFVSMMRNLDGGDDMMDAENLMYMADYDENGHIDWEEFSEFMYNNMGGENIDNETWSYWNGHFDNADMDSDGQLNMTELNEFWYRVTDDSGDDFDLEDFALGQDWTVSLGYTDTDNFTFYIGSSQILADEFRATVDMVIGDGDGYLNATEAEQAYFWLIDNLDTEPQGPENITLNDVPAEVVFIGYEIMDLSSDNAYNTAIIATWDVVFHNVESDNDGHYTFAYMEDTNDQGVDTPANFCAVSYEYSYQIIEFVWNSTNIELEDGECISLNLGEIIPSFSITYGQEANMDYDNDGVDNEDDAFPYDPSETMDTDGDGWGDNTDAFPNDATEWLDTDGDGVGDNADTDYDGDGTDDDQEDSDGDGVNDDQDDFPNDANESTDTDGDGVGDNSDVFPNNANESSDLDGDGIGDNGDEDADGDGTPNDVDDFPLASSSNDADNDGVVNEIDAFPNNPNEYFDSDGDGTGDNADLDDDNDGYADTVDAFPNDLNENLDSDGDGMGDNEDQFPNDANEKKDSDGDGVGDNSDAFPSNFNDWADTDNDGVGDNADAFPNDATEIVDSDGDGVGNNADAFPYNANEQSDSDGDGVGDNAQAEQDGGTNPVKPEPVDDGGFLPGFSSAMGIVSMLGAAILIAGRRKD